MDVGKPGIMANLDGREYKGEDNYLYWKVES
jgi:hypothetical protein